MTGKKIVGNYIVDFYVKSLRLVVEVDGSSHEQKHVYDDKREAFFISLGLKVYRIGDLRMKMDTENVMKELEEFIVENYG